MLTTPPRFICALLVGMALAGALTGCGGRAKTPPPPPPTYSPEDDAPADTTVAEGLGAADASAYRMTVDAMVGQINGRPVYASEIFNQIGEDSLIRLGATNTRAEFRKQVMALLNEHLAARVQSQLILAEAEGDLSPQEQLGLLGMLKVEREKILAQFFGSEAEAQRGLQQQRGMTLDDYLEAKRQQVLVEKYLHEKMYPKIIVNRRDVERYYQAHHDEFNPKPSVTVRLIFVNDEKAADQVDEAFGKGEAFEDVAKEFSTRLASQGGLMPAMQQSRTNFRGLKWSELNEQMRTLKVGAHSVRTKIDDGFAWVQLVDVVGAEGRTLTEVYPLIENRLRAAQLDQLSRKYNIELLKKGNFTPLDEMLTSLLDIAMARYARPE